MLTSTIRRLFLSLLGVTGLAFLTLSSAGGVDAEQSAMFRVAPPKTMVIFDPRISGAAVTYSPIGERVIVEGDIDLGTVEDVLLNSWSLAISVAKEASDPKHQKIFNELKPSEQERIKLLSRKKKGDLPPGRQDSERILHDAIDVLSPLQDLRNNNTDAENQQQSAAIFEGASQEFRWKDGKIPYVLDPGFLTPERAVQKELIEQAITHWNMKTMLVRIAPVVNPNSPPPDYVLFVPTVDSYFSECVGRRPTGGKQVIGLCSGCKLPQIIHEIGHVVGLFHEQNRNDRDDHIVIHQENMQIDAAAQFAKIQWKGKDVGPFDFESIMLYPYKAFSKNGQPTMTAKLKPNDKAQSPADKVWGLDTGAAGGKSMGLSTGDVKGIEWLYKKKE